MKLFGFSRVMLLGMLCNTPSMYGEQTYDSVTNAFEDLKKGGVVDEQMSPMRIPASLEQMNELKSKADKGYLCFPETRENSIRLFNAVPKVWLERNPALNKAFKAKGVRPDEYYVFQIGVYAAKAALKEVRMDFSSMKGEGKGQKIESQAFTCFNLEGVNPQGKPFEKSVTVEEGMVQPLWVGVQIPKNAQGLYTGTITVKGQGAVATEIPVEFLIEGQAVKNHGMDTAYSLARLAWLNSTLGVSEKPTAPYIPIKVKGKKLSVLGADISLSDSGLPASIITHYDESNRLDNSKSNPVLAQPVEFIIETENGKESLKSGNLKMGKVTEGSASWTSLSSNESWDMNITGRMEFDGFMSYTLVLTPKKDMTVKDMRLSTPYTESSSKYIMGLGEFGGLRKKENFDWKWETATKHQDALWLGGVQSGLVLRFKDENYKRPLVNVYYQLGALQEPTSWGKGGVRYSTNEDKSIVLEAYSGEKTLKKGESLTFVVDMRITPVKPLNLAFHTSNRYFHNNSDVSGHYIEEAKKKGATRINIHHKKDIYPYINYPYFDDSIEDFKGFISKAADEGLDVGVYYTTRELTVNIPEIWALRSLDNEILHDGPGPDTKTLIHNGSHSWLKDNFKSNFIPAWYCGFSQGKYKGKMDLSVITTPDSRWNNYYLAGLNWMIENMGIKGVYIDDSALDRETLKRARRIMDNDGQKRLVDMHSWNHFNGSAGHANSLLLYTDLFPYVDRLWIGEGFGESNSLDTWMVTMSGIPFGVMSETLDAHNPWKGLVYGMTPRLGWSGDPTALWKMYDDFNMKEAKMLGYWVQTPAVKTSQPDAFPTTVYIHPKHKKAIVAIASWSDKDGEISLSLDEKALGFTPSKVSKVALDKMQEGGTIDMKAPQTIKPKSGLILLLEE